MKKLIAFILILAMLTVAMVSCKKEDPTETPVTPDPPAQETKYTITAEEWAATCALTNFTAIQHGNATYTMGDQTETEETIATYKNTATALYAKVQETGDPTYEEYTVISDGRVYSLQVLEDGSIDVHSSSRTELDNFAETFDFDGVTFDSLVYNAETKAYDLDLSEEGMSMKYSFFFENGQIVKLVANATMSEHGTVAVMTIEVTVSDIGTTTVTVPDFERPTE